MIRSSTELHWRRRTRHARRWSYYEAIGREMRRTRVIVTDRCRHLTDHTGNPVIVNVRLDRRTIYLDGALVRRQRSHPSGLDTVFSLAWSEWLNAFIHAEAIRRAESQLLADAGFTRGGAA